MKVEQVPESRQTGSRLPRLFAGERQRQFIYLVLNGVLQALLAVTSALLIRYGFDTLMSPGVPFLQASALQVGLGLLTILIVTAVLRWRGVVDAEMMGQSYVHAVRMRLFRHLLRMGSEGAQQMGRGSVMLRFVGDLNALRQWVSLGLARLLVSGVMVSLALIGLAIIAPVMALSVTATVLLSGLIFVAMGKPLRDATRELRRRRGLLATPLNDRLSKLAVIEAFGQQQQEYKRFKRLSRRVRSESVRRMRIVAALRVIAEGGASLAGLCALFSGFILVSLSQVSPGTVVAAMVISGLLAPRLQELGRIYEYWNGAVVARRKQEQLLNIKVPERNRNKVKRKRTLKPSHGELVLRGVKKQGRVGPVDMQIKAGQKVFIVGGNGAGKSTLLRMMAGLVSPDTGSVLLDGQNIARCGPESVRKQFAMVAPELPLLRGSLRFNLTYGVAGVGEDELLQTIDACGLSVVVQRLERGLMTRITENGEGLSTGERARITLARALLMKPKVLLLDEAEANLDPVARKSLDKVIDDFPGTVVAISHDVQRAEQADLILQLEKGELLYFGSAAQFFKRQISPFLPGTADNVVTLQPDPAYANG